MDRFDVAIIIPAYNEATTLSKVIDEVKGVGQVIVVDDGSCDKTSEVAEQNGAVVVRHATNLGYDQALNSGFHKASELKFKYAITIDADGQHDTRIIQKFIDYLRGSVDLVIGIRDRRQRFGEHIFSFVVSFLYSIKDPLCGMKGYSMELYSKLGHFDSYNSIGTELALFSVKNHCHYVQVAVPTRPRQGVSRFGQNLTANYKLLRALFFSLFKL